MTSELPPAAWYPDPADEPGQKYWDGHQWNPDSTAPGAATRPDKYSAQPSAYQPNDKRPPSDEGVKPMKIVFATAGLLTVAALTACGSGSSGGAGSSGGHSDDYNKGYDIASHELVQSQVSAMLAVGKSAGAAAQGACEDAYNTYTALDSINNMDDYVKGCADAVNANPAKTTNP
jgi:hypothetical protein